MAKAKSVSIEENFEQLEDLIGRLEVYETGIKLTAQCSKQLDKVEKQLITLRNEADSQASDGDEN